MKLLIILDCIGLILTYLGINCCKNTDIQTQLKIKLSGKIVNRYLIVGYIRFITIILILVTICRFLFRLI